MQKKIYNVSGDRFPIRAVINFVSYFIKSILTLTLFLISFAVDLKTVRFTILLGYDSLS